MPTPYINQLDNAPRSNDCGPAACVMLAGDDRPELVTPATVTRLSQQFDAPQNGTTPADVLRMLAALGVDGDLTRESRYPYIALVDYRALPSRWQVYGDFAHWIVRLSDTTYHDPLGRGTWGANRSAQKAELDAAELAARRWIASVPVPVRIAKKNTMSTTPQTKGKAKIKTGPWKVRSAPDQTTTSLTGMTFKAGQEIDVMSIVPGGAYSYGVVSMSAGGAPVYNATASAPFVYYVRADGFEWVGAQQPPPPPTSVGAFRLGLHVMGNAQVARDEAARGCRYFMLMNDFGGAQALKRDYPDATVMVRRWFPQNFFLSPDQVIAGLDGANNGPLVYTGFNEADQGDHRGKALVDRARIDIEVARKIKARNPGAVYAAGTFSVGTPDFTDPEVCRIIREEYAPHYNSGLIGFDMHLYSPNMAQIDQPGEWQWHERRWEFLFTRCGFDPNVRAIYCGETGLDEGGVGGFPAHNATHDYFKGWCRKFIALQTAPLVVNGKSYPSPIVGGAIFQAFGNGDPRWRGYDVSGYLPALREFYAPVAVRS